MKTSAILAVSALAIIMSSCSKSDEKPRRGKYKAEVELTALELPGMTPAMRQDAEAQLQATFAKQVGAEQCLGGTKKDEWKRISSEISKGMGGSCSTVRDTSTDSTVDMEVKCSGPQTGEMTVTIKGAAERESFGLDANMEMKGMGGRGDGKVGLKISAKRMGDC